MMAKQTYSEIMQNFTIENLPTLDICVLGALELFERIRLPTISVPKKGRILVIGSGNALDTGMILFEERDAIFASESVYKKKLKTVDFNHAVIISASGGKHAPALARHMKREKIASTLITNTPDSPASKYVDKTYVFPKQREPYTYNTSTYLSMILSKTRESPKKIRRHIMKISKTIPKDLKKYGAFNFIVPAPFDSAKDMFETKFDELFGPKVMGRVFTLEEEKHAKTVVKSDKELFVIVGSRDATFGTKKNRFYLPLPKDADYGTIIATVYFFIGKIQCQDERYFRKNIVAYTKKISKVFGQKISPIVE